MSTIEDAAKATAVEDAATAVESTTIEDAKAEAKDATFAFDQIEAQVQPP